MKYQILYLQIILKIFKASLTSKKLMIIFLLRVFSKLFFIKIKIQNQEKPITKKITKNKIYKSVDIFIFKKKISINLNLYYENIILLFILFRRFDIDSKIYYNLLQKIQLQKKYSIVELGCGPSLFVNNISNILNYKYTGVDYCKTSLDIAMRLNKKNQFKFIDINKLKIKKNTIYIGNSILNHIDYKNKIIKEIIKEKSLFIFLESNKLIKINTSYQMIKVSADEYLFTNIDEVICKEIS